MQRLGAREEDCEGLVNYALSMGDVQVAIFFRELPDRRFRVSLRSKGEVNVSTVAEHFGGGGHKCASGCSIDGPLAVAVSRIVERLRAEAVVLNARLGGGTDERLPIAASSAAGRRTPRLSTKRTGRMHQKANPQSRTDALLLVAFCGFLFFYGLGALVWSEPTSRVTRRWRAKCLIAPIG